MRLAPSSLAAHGSQENHPMLARVRQFTNAFVEAVGLFGGQHEALLATGKNRLDFAESRRIFKRRGHVIALAVDDLLDRAAQDLA
jgi:hypothetical protein